LDLTEACMWGTISGGFACFYIGGTYFEKYPGEKRGLINPYYDKYKNQIALQDRIMHTNPTSGPDEKE